MVKNKALVLFISLLIVSCYYFIFKPINVYASKIIFSEDFLESELNNTIWTMYKNGGSIDLDSNNVNLSAEFSRTFPYVSANGHIFPTSNDFKLELGIRYTEVTPWGTGVVLVNTLPPNGSAPPEQNWLFAIWQDSNGKFSIIYNDCNSIGQCTRYSIPEKRTIDLFGHDVSIVYKSGIYEVILDRKKIYTSAFTERRPITFYLGNPDTLSQNLDWTDFLIDYIRITDLNAPSPTTQPTINPTPTATPTIKNPIIIVPGFSASWNKDALFHGKSVSYSEWTRAPFAPDYDGLMETIKTAGYSDDQNDTQQNLFSFDYDWRQSINVTADNLADFINTRVLKKHPHAKIKIVGHSLGGLVGRTYLQKYGDTNVNQLITIGTPHQGLVKSYYLLEGGIVPPEEDIISRIGIGLYELFNQELFDHPTDIVQKTIPSVRDLLPIYDFLKSAKSGQIIKIGMMKQQNNWLRNLQNGLPFYFSLFDAIAGRSYPTKEWLYVVKPSGLDQFFHSWEDGNPIRSDSNTKGDHTVLLRSASVEGDQSHVIPSNHGDLVHDKPGIEMITNLLDIHPTKFVAGHGTTLPSIIFALLSPARMELTSPQGEKLSDNEMIIISGANTGNYALNVIGKESGSYGLGIGILTNQSETWREFTETIAANEVDTYRFHFDPNNLSTSFQDKLNSEYFLRSSREKLLKLQSKSNNSFLNRSIMEINQVLEDLNVRKTRHLLGLLYQSINNIFTYRFIDRSDPTYLYNQTNDALLDIAQAFSIIQITGDLKSRVNIRKFAKIKTALDSSKRQFEKKQEKGQATKRQALSLLQAEKLVNQTEKALADNNRALAKILIFEIPHFINESNRPL